jgi:hypothetical protein
MQNDSRHRFLNLTLFYILHLAPFQLRVTEIGSSGKMAWGDKIVVAIALLILAPIVIVLFLCLHRDTSNNYAVAHIFSMQGECES